MSPRFSITLRDLGNTSILTAVSDLPLSNRSSSALTGKAIRENSSDAVVKSSSQVFGWLFFMMGTVWNKTLMHPYQENN